jgi:FKBP-type peptidyl-prolyl cis-trans isomerase 2
MNKKILVLFSYSFLLLVVGCGAPRIIDDADGVSVEYRLSFEDGTLYRSGTEYIEIGKYDTDLADMFTDLLIGKQGDDVFTGMLSPDETYGKQYDYSLQQKLAEPYLSAMGSEPVV